MRIFPEIPEFEEVDFSQYSTPYGALLMAFLDSGKTSLREFEEFVEENGGTKADVGRFLISIFQYPLIRYRRYGDESVEVPAFKIFLTLKGWLNENNFENDYRRLLHSFVGYLVDSRQDCGKVRLRIERNIHENRLPANDRSGGNFRREVFQRTQGEGQRNA